MAKVDCKFLNAKKECSILKRTFCDECDECAFFRSTFPEKPPKHDLDYFLNRGGYTDKDPEPVKITCSYYTKNGCKATSQKNCAFCAFYEPNTVTKTACLSNELNKMYLEIHALKAQYRQAAEDIRVLSGRIKKIQKQHEVDQRLYSTEAILRSIIRHRKKEEKRKHDLYK